MAASPRSSGRRVRLASPPCRHRGPHSRRALESLVSVSKAAWSGADCQARHSDCWTGRCADCCRSNASSHRRRNNTTPAPTREQPPAVTVVETEPLSQAPQEKPDPPTSPSTQPTTNGASALAPRRRADAGTTADATALFRCACPICRGSFYYLDTTRREGIGQRAGGGRVTPDPSRATSRVGCGDILPAQSERGPLLFRYLPDGSRTSQRGCGRASVATSNGE